MRKTSVGLVRLRRRAKACWRQHQRLKGHQTHCRQPAGPAAASVDHRTGCWRRPSVTPGRILVQLAPVVTPVRTATQTGLVVTARRKHFVRAARVRRRPIAARADRARVLQKLASQRLYRIPKNQTPVRPVLQSFLPVELARAEMVLQRLMVSPLRTGCSDLSLMEPQSPR